MRLFEWPATGIVAGGVGRHGWAPPNSDSLNGGDDSVYVCEHVGAHTRDVQPPPWLRA